MTIGMLQSTVFGDLFGTEAMREVFGERALFRNCAVVRGGPGAGAGAARHQSPKKRPWRSRKLSRRSSREKHRSIQSG